MRTWYGRSLIGLGFLLCLFVITFLLTDSANPHTAELSFAEDSNYGIGSVVPASCESFGYYEHSPYECWYSFWADRYSITSGETVNLYHNISAPTHTGCWIRGYQGGVLVSNVQIWNYPGFLQPNPLNTGPLYATTQYDLYCENVWYGFANTKSLTITVSAPPSCPLPWGGTIPSGSSVTAYQSSSVTLPTTCTSPGMSETRTCTAGTLSGSYTNQSCTASCPVGTIWNGSSCVVLNGSLSATPSTVSYNGTTTVSWNVTNAGTLSCQVSRTGASVWSGTSGSQVDTLTATRTYILSCGSVAVDSETVTVVINPTLTVNRRLVEEGSEVSLTYNTNGQTCTLSTGASVTGNGVFNVPSVTAQTTFILDCGAFGSPSVTVEILPRGFET